MAGKNPQLPRVVPNTLLEVKFVQRGGKLYKILLPNPLKHNNPTNTCVSQPATSPIVFEARNAKGLESTRKSNEPSPFLKPVTLSSAEYKSIPLFTRGERIVDTDWLPEETECIIQLVKSHKAFQDAANTTTSAETLLPKIVSVNSNENMLTEYSSFSNQTVSPLVDDVSEMVEGQRKFVTAFAKRHEESTMIKNFEKVTPVCELKVEPLNGENCIFSDIEPKMNPSVNKIVDVQAKNSTSLLKTSMEVKPVSTLPNGKCVLPLKETSVCSANQGTIKVSESSATLMEDAKTVPLIEMTSKESVNDSSNEEKALLLERLKNARTVKIKHHGSNSVPAEEIKSILQADMGNKSETGSSAMLPSSINVQNGMVKSEPIETASVSPAQKKVMLRLQRPENSTNACGVTAEIALMDHDYALSPKGRTVSNYSLRHLPRPKSQPTSMYSYTESAKLSRNLTKVQARSRKPSTFCQGVAQNTDKSVTIPISDNIFLQHQTDDNGKPSLTFPVSSVMEKQNSIALGRAVAAGKANPANLIKGVIKLLMPKSFSSNCSSENTAQALNRIAKLSAVASTSGIYPGPVASTNAKITQPNYNKAYNVAQTSTAQIVTVSCNPSEGLVCSEGSINSQFPSSLNTDSSSTDEEFNIMEPEVLITESNDTFIIEDGKLKLCVARKKPVRRKKASRKLPKNKEINHVYGKKIPDEAKKVTNGMQSIEISIGKQDSTNHVHDKDTSNPSLKRTGKYQELIQNTKYQRETLLPPAPKVRKLFICRTEKTASSLLQSCFVWLDKMDEQFLDNGRLDTIEVPEDILFSIRDTSHPYTNRKHYESKAAYLEEEPIVIIEPPAEENDSFSTEIVDRKEAENRMADVLRLLEEKRKAIEVLRQKNQSQSVAPTVSQTLE